MQVIKRTPALGRQTEAGCSRPLHQACRHAVHEGWRQSPQQLRQSQHRLKQLCIVVTHAASTQPPSVDEAVAEVARSAQEGTDALQQGVQEAINGAQQQLSISFDTPLPEQPVGRTDKLQLGEGLIGDVIRVPADFEARTGLKITDELTVGKELGGGVQGLVYVLEGPNGESTDKLLKVMKYKAATPITGLDIGLKREWLIGQQLNTLRGEDGELHGFMATGEALVQDDDTQVGLVIEKVNGLALAKRLVKDDKFADIQYLLTCVRQVFGFLDYAYQAIGFSHGDLNTENVMEHREEGRVLLPKGFASEDMDELTNEEFLLPGDDEARKLEFRIIDYGHARLARHKCLQQLPDAPLFEKLGYRRWWDKRGDVWRLLQDVAVTMDGRTWNVKDEPEVRLLIGLIRKVTGVTIAAFFRTDRVGAVRYSGKTSDMPWHKTRGFGHEVRKVRMRVTAFSLDKNQQMRPAEALQWLKEKEDFYQRKYAYARE